MNSTHLRSVVSLALLSIPFAALGGCASAAPEGAPSDDVASAAPKELPAHAKLMLTDQARARLLEQLPAVPEEGTPEAESQTGMQTTSSAQTLHYYGGPVVQNVHVVPVYWNANVANQSHLNAFYSAVSTGQYMSFLSQYSTSSPAQTIGNGSRGTPYVSNQTSTNVTDAQIQTFLKNQFNAGTLPKPSNNNYYPIHFSSGVKITDSSGNVSCVQFCAYHGTGTYNGQDFYYGVLPDLSNSGCNGGCGGSTVANNETSVASHEFAETVTDAAVGLATVYGPPLAWYNSTYGEIGDICNGQQATVTLGDGASYTVQKLWSNKSSACVAP